jgi:hypothetical protein
MSYRDAPQARPGSDMLRYRLRMSRRAFRQAIGPAGWRAAHPGYSAVDYAMEPARGRSMALRRNNKTSGTIKHLPLTYAAGR